MINEKKRVKARRHGSGILRGLGALASLVHRGVKNGLVGRLMSRYTAENDSLHRSLSASAVKRDSKFGQFVRQARFTVGEQFEESRIATAVRRVYTFLLGCKLRLYGTFLATFGLYTALVYAAERYLFHTAVNEDFLVCGIVTVLAALPLILSGRTFADAVRTSRAGTFLFCNFFGIPSEKFNVAPERHGDAYNFAIIAGVAAGSLTFFLSPVYVYLAIIAIIAVAVILSFPETGVLIAILLLPFGGYSATSGLLGAVTLLFSFGYAVKFLRGKRVLHFDIFDLALAFFALAVSLAQLVRGGSGASGAENCLLLLVGCFVAGNLMRTKPWIRRCVYSLTASATFSSMIYIWQRVTERVGTVVIGKSAIRLFPAGVEPFFDSGDLFAAYLTVAFIFTLCSAGSLRGMKRRTVCMMSSVAILTAIFLTGSVSGIFGVAVAWLFFVIAISRRALVNAFFIFLIALSAMLVLPTAVYSWLGRAVNSGSGAVVRILRTWQGAARLAVATLFGGTGFGGFDALYPSYAVPGFESATDSSALWLQLLCEMGIVGLLLFGFAVFLIIQNCFEFASRTEDRRAKKFTLATMATLVGLLSQSMLCDIFADERIFFAFWLICTLTCAYIRLCRTEAEDALIGKANTEYAATAEL